MMKLPTLLFYSLPVLLNAEIFSSHQDGNLDLRLETQITTHSYGDQKQDEAITESSDFFSSRTKEVLSILENVRKLPTCNKNAAKSLVHNCQSLETDPLELVKAIYAVRLAVCELNEASMPIAHECKAFAADQASRKRTFRGWLRPNGPSEPAPYDSDYERATEEALDACLVKLRREPQSWTSYSNNRQNAVVLCRAARAEVEHDENINLLKSFTEATYRQMSDLFESREHYESVKKDFHQLTVKIRGFHVQLFDDHEHIKTSIERSWDESVQKWQQHLERMAYNVQHINQKIVDALDVIDLYEQQNHEAHARAATHLADLALKQQSYTNNLGDELSSLSEVIRFMEEVKLQSVLQALAKAGTSLKDIDAASALHLLQIEEHRLKMARASDSLETLQEKAMQMESDLVHIHEEQLTRHLQLQQAASTTQNLLDAVNKPLAVAVEVLASVTEMWQGLGFSSLMIRVATLIANFASALVLLLFILSIGKVSQLSIWIRFSISFLLASAFATMCTILGGPAELLLHLCLT